MTSQQNQASIKRSDRETDTLPRTQSIPIPSANIAPKKLSNNDPNLQTKEDQIVDSLVDKILEFNKKELNNNDQIQTKVKGLHNDVLNIFQDVGYLNTQQTENIRQNEDYKNSIENITRLLQIKSISRFDTILSGISEFTKNIGFRKISNSIIDHVAIKSHLRMCYKLYRSRRAPPYKKNL